MVYTAKVKRALAPIARVMTYFEGPAPDSLIEKVLPQISILIGQTNLPAARLRRAPKLRAIINVLGNWRGNIDYHTAQKAGIRVLTVAPAIAPAVAEYCLGQAINLGRGLRRADELFRCGQERYGIKGNQKVTSLYGAKVGLIGFGNLGRALVPLLAPFGSQISVYDPWVSARYLSNFAVRQASLEAVLENSRFIFILAGATDTNKGFLDRKTLRLIKQDACVILASRALVVDFRALTALAQEGRFRLAVDVFPAEPVSKDASIRGFDQILFSAHIAGGTRDSYRLMCDMMIDDIRLILSGHPPLHLQQADPNLAPRMRSL